MDPHDLTQRWDARWTPAEQDEAIAAADDQALRARYDLDAALKSVARALDGVAQAVKWTATIRLIRVGVSRRTEPTE